MIDPFNITNFNRNEDELIELLLFSVFVAGHNAKTTSIHLEEYLNTFLDNWKISLKTKLISYVKNNSARVIAKHLKKSGIGCYKRNANFIITLANKLNDIDLKTISILDLEKFKGIGPKTSRFFILHSRENVANIAVLDTHVLKYLKEQGFDVPKTTPTGAKYYFLEQKFIELAKKNGKSVAGFDLEVWKSKVKYA